MKTLLIVGALMLAGCSQTLPEGWDSVEAVKADLGTQAFGEFDNRWVKGPSVSVSAPLSCAAGAAYDPRDSFDQLRAQANTPGTGMSVMNLRSREEIRTFLVRAGLTSASGNGVTQNVNGIWVISIARDLSPKEKRDALLHELDHVMCGRRDG